MGEEDHTRLIPADEVESDILDPVVPDVEIVKSGFIRSSKKRLACGGIVGCLGAILAVLGALCYVYFPVLVDYFVTQQVVLEDGNEVYTLWREPPIPIYSKFYFFNVTNPVEIEKNKAMPILKEVGPYTYREHWVKVNITFNSNGTVSYQQRRDIQFVPEMSVGPDSELVTSANVPMVTAASLFRNSGMMMKLALSAVFNMLNERIFINKTVRQLLFDGYTDPLTTMAKDIMHTYPFDKFAYLMGRNGTKPAVINVFTGKMDYKLFNIVDNYDGKRVTPWWGDTPCGMPNGTDGSGFPALRNRDSPLYVFIPDACRSLELDYEMPSTAVGDRDVYRYTATKRLFANATDNPENKCFCPSGKCLPSGAMNISACTFGAPVLISLPHFYLADPIYLKGVEGLHPNKTLHEFVADIDAITGAPVSVNGRLQLNIAIERIPGLSVFEKMHNVVLPILWFEQSAQLTPDIVNYLIRRTQDPIYYSQIAAYVAFTIGIAASLVGLFLVVTGIARSKTQELTGKDNDGAQITS